MATTIKLKNGSGAPTAGQLVQGEPALDLVNKRLYTEDSGGNVIEVGVNPAGEIQANAGIALPDSQKATFGASDDLQIYHDGSNSYIGDFGTGNLNIRGANLQLQDPDGYNYITAVDNGTGGEVILYHNNSGKLATTTTGIDVTGTVTADGLTVAGNAYVGSGNYFTDVTSGYFFGGNGSYANGIYGYGTNNCRISTDSKSRLTIDSGGDISFYEDTGTTAKFFWDASAESLGIGTSSPAVRAHVYITEATNEVLRIEQGTSARGAQINFKNPHNSGVYIGLSGDSSGDLISYNGAATNQIFYTNAAERMRIDSSGNVGIGTSSPTNRLSFGATANINERLINLFSGTTNANGYVSIGSQYAHDNSYVNSEIRFGNEVSSGAPSFLAFATTTGATPVERMRIDSSGNLLINTTTTRTGTDAICLEGGNVFMNMRRNGSGSVQLISFTRNTDTTPTTAGFIATTGTATNYSTSSDYRLKENVVPMDNASSRVLALKPCRFNFIADPEKTVDGFLAHEAQEVVPEAVHGTKDEVDDEGNPVYQGIDQSKLVPLLTKALQEALTEIESLKARVSALEA